MKHLTTNIGKITVLNSFSLNKKLDLLILFYVYIFCRHVCMCGHVCAWCPLKSEEDIGSPGTGFMCGCEPPCGCCELNLVNSVLNQ